MSDNTKPVDTIGLSWSLHGRRKGHAQLRFRLGGRQYSITTGVKNPRKVNRALQIEILRAWLDRHPDAREHIGGAHGITPEIGRYIALQYEGRARKTVADVRAHLLAFRDILGVQAVEEITQPLCEAKKPALQEGKAPKTWKNFLTNVRRFLRWEQREGNLPSDPLINFVMPSRADFGRRLATWTPERYQLTRALLNKEDREMVTLLYETGIDTGDLFHLRPQHVLETRRPDGSRFRKLFKRRGKAKTSREVIDQPLSTGALKLILPRVSAWWDLSRYRDERSFAANLLKRAHRAQRKAGFEDVLDLKSLRHTFASRHAARYIEGRGGPPMEELRRWMGHAPDSRVLERLYVHAQSSGLYMD